MAETITYRATITPRVSQRTESHVDGQTVHEVVLTNAQRAAIDTLLTEIKAGTDVAAVITAINAL